MVVRWSRLDLYRVISTLISYLLGFEFGFEFEMLLPICTIAV